MKKQKYLLVIMAIDKDLVMKRFNKSIVTWDRFA